MILAFSALPGGPLGGLLGHLGPSGPLTITITITMTIIITITITPTRKIRWAGGGSNTRTPEG
eukprot:2845594-Pyramimonas_sp.AAC.1